MIFVYIVVKGVIAVTNLDDTKRNKVVAFKNNAPFMNCISKINGVQIDNTDDQDVVMPMYNLLEYSKSCTKTTARVIITEMNQVIPFLLILNPLNKKQVLQEILMILLLAMLIMMQPKLVKMKLKLLFH